MSERKTDRGRVKGPGREAEEFIRPFQRAKQRAEREQHARANEKQRGPKAGAGPRAVVKITRFSKTRDQVYRHVSYLTKREKGEKDWPEMETDTGEKLSGKKAAARFMDEFRDAMEPSPSRPSTAAMVEKMEALSRARGQAMPYGALDDMRVGLAHIAGKAANPKQERRTMQMVISTPDKAGYSREQVHAWARDFGKETFLGKYRYAFVVHEDKGHMHAHFVVGVNGTEPEKLNPKRADLKLWRDTASATAERHGIELSSEHRANPDLERRKPWLKKNELDARTTALIAHSVKATLALEGAALRGAVQVEREERDQALAKRRQIPVTKSQARVLAAAEKQGKDVGEARSSRSAADAWIRANTAPSSALVAAVAAELHPSKSQAHRVAQQRLSASDPVSTKPRNTTHERVTVLFDRLANDLQRTGDPSPLVKAFAAEIGKASGTKITARTTTGVRESLEKIAPEAMRSLRERGRAAERDEPERG